MARKIETIISELFQKEKSFNFAEEVIAQLMYQVKSKNGKLNILVAYHSDLDGCASAFGIYKMLESALTSLRVEEVDVVYKRINYNYNLEKCMGKETREADLVFVVDYSFSTESHMRFFIDNLKVDADMIWIDHHDTSIKLETDGLLEGDPRKETVETFMNMDKLHKYLYTEKGCSGALLVTILGKLVVEGVKDIITDSECSLRVLYLNEYKNKLNEFINNFPHIIEEVSLYDTFHPDASREFYYAINTVEYDPQTAMENGKNVFSDVWESLLNECWDNINEELVLNDYWNGFYINLRDSFNYEELLKKGKYILEFDKQSNMIYQRGTMFDVILKFKDKEYKAAVINAKGNSYKFEDTYYNRDCVIIFYFNNQGTYTYSIFVDENNDKIERVNAREIAEVFGGGGHTGAAGFTFNSNIFESVLQGRTPLFGDTLNGTLLEITKA